MKYLIRYLTVVVALVALSACDDYERTTFDYSGKTTITLADRTLHTLTFEWSAVDEAVSYDYTLVPGALTESKENAIASGNTTSLSQTFSNLDPGTTYTLWVKVNEGGTKVSRSFYQSASTVAIVALDTPAPVATDDEENFYTTITWPAVENAARYVYQYTLGDVTVRDTTELCTVGFSTKGYDAGRYPFYVTALSEMEAYSTSARGVCYFNIGEAKPITAYDMEGTYYNYCYGTMYVSSSYSWNTEWEADYVSVITAVDEETITITNVYLKYSLTGTVDMDNKTITFKPTKWGSYYFAADNTDDSGYTTSLLPLTATFDDAFNIVTDCYIRCYDYYGTGNYYAYSYLYNSWTRAED